MPAMRHTTKFDENAHTYYIDGVAVPSVTQICSILTAGKYSGGRGVIDAARARGTAVHELCEAYDYGTLEEVPTELAGYVKAYSDFCRDYRPEWLYIEHQMYSRQLKYAGTCDRVGMIDGKWTVVDLKTTANMDRASKLSLLAQLAAYQELAYTIGEAPDMTNGLGVQLKRDGSYTVHTQYEIMRRYDADGFTLFRHCQQIHYALEGMPKWNSN